MTKRMGTIVAIVLCLGTATNAKPITAEQAAQFKVGSATQAEVIGAFGKPGTMAVNSDGTTQITYMASKTSVKAATFVPIVGLFAGGAKGSVSLATFVFDKDGVLKSFSTTNTNCDYGMMRGGGC